jgi:chromosome partitioning protein
MIKAHRVSFMHHKGGTGKTTTCINVAGCLQKLKKKVLVVDMDPQANATTGLGLAKDEMEGDIFQVLFESYPVMNSVVESPSGVCVVPGSSRMLSAEIFFARQTNQSENLKEKLDKLSAYFDFILVDLPPSSTMVLVNGLIAAPRVVVPMDSGVFAYETLSTFGYLLENIEDQFGVFCEPELLVVREMSADAKDVENTGKVLELTRDFMKEREWDKTKLLTVPWSSLVFDAQMKGIPISHLSPQCKVNRVYREIARDLIKSK